MKKIIMLSIAIWWSLFSAYPQQTGAFTDSRDGKTYKTVKIGTQIWMAENLVYNTDDGCWANDKDKNNIPVYGFLYNWQTAMKACPSGWHLPTDEEWIKLADYLGGMAVAGGKMKEKGTEHWPYPNTGATNESGFTALPGGLRYQARMFDYLGTFNCLWSASEVQATSAMGWELRNNYVDLTKFPYGKEIGRSVRCLSDKSTADNSKLTNTESKSTAPAKDVKPGAFTDSRDNKTYKTVKIGSQTWMVENLAYKANSGCWAYNNDVTNVAKYGYLYDWETAKTACPSGWHLSGDDEWSTLLNFLGGADAAGGKLKSVTGWDTPNVGATNSSGFTSLPGGWRKAIGEFAEVGKYGGWWSSTSGNTTGAWSRDMDSGYEDVDRFGTSKVVGLSVRCIKD